jgi:hypothetical protein
MSISPAGFTNPVNTGTPGTFNQAGGGAGTLLTPEIVAALSSSSGQNINAGQFVQLGPFDARQYASYYLEVNAVAAGAPVQFNPVTVEVRWNSIPTIGASEVYADTATFWGDSLAGAFQFLGGNMYMEDIHHGPFFHVNIMNNSPIALVVGWDLFNTTRSLPGPYFRQGSGNGPAGVLCFLPFPQAIGAGATVNVACLYGYGRVTTRLIAVPNMNFDFFLAGNANSWDQYGGVGGPLRPELVLPKMAARIAVTNPGAVGQFGLNVTTQFERM